MPSRLYPPPSTPAAASSTSPSQHHRHTTLITPIAAGSAAVVIFLLLAFLCRRLSRSRTAPADLPNAAARRFPYSHLRRATARFSPANKLGQGGFGSVYRASNLPGSPNPVAVKLMDSGSMQGEREFHNELVLAALTAPCDRVVSLLGFSSDRRRRRLLLVYELMLNRSLQDALLDRRLPELMPWSRRFSVALDVARGLVFLHCDCDPPIIHGDIKPSNILLDECFSAKIADFGLARLKTAAAVLDVPPAPATSDAEAAAGDDENGSILEETGSVTPRGAAAAEMHSPESFLRTEASPETVPPEASPSEILDRASASEGGYDKMSVDSSKEAAPEKRSGQKKWRRTEGESGGIRVKEYVMEWIGSEVKRERPKSGVWMAEVEEAAASSAEGKMAKSEKKRLSKRLEWWTSLDDDRGLRKKDKPRPRQPREWWREEFCDELYRKSRKKNKAAGSENSDEQWWLRDHELRKKKKRRRRSQSSMEWWMDGLSGELRWGRRNSLDCVSGDISRSGCVSSTPSMRGTVCYIAPEYGGGGQLSEKCDVYSFGVLLLVIVSGRRPLQVTASPISEFERANLISWARSLSRCGKLLDLVDPAIQGVDKDQALLCITVALLCLQRSPAQRPTMLDVVAMLAGNVEPPHLPVEFSPSPPSGFPFKSRRKAR